MSNPVKQPRELNVELLRIVLMIMIVCHHFLMRGRGLHLLYISDSKQFSGDALHGLFIDSFLIMTVNCFVFISGYYGIKFRIKTILSLLIQAITYSLLIDVVFAMVNNEPFSWESVCNALWSVPEGQWWFITTYFFLYLLSPFINLAKRYLTKFQFLYVLSVLTVINFVVAFTLDPSSLGVLNGYSLFSFICVYFYGQACSSYLDLKLGKWFYLAIYLACSLLIYGMFMLGLRQQRIDLAWRAFSYNNPLVMLSAIAFFYFFKQIKVSYRWISFFSSSVLAVYLVHEHPVSADLLTDHLNSLAGTYKVGDVYFTLFLMALLLFIGCTLIEKIRVAVTEPILNHLIKWFKMDKLDKKMFL